MCVKQEIDIENDLEFLADKNDWDESDEELNDKDESDNSENIKNKKQSIERNKVKKLLKITKKKLHSKKLDLTFENVNEEENEIN